MWQDQFDESYTMQLFIDNSFCNFKGYDSKYAEINFYNPLSLIKANDKLEYEYVLQFNFKIYSV